jgi:hypothetical protein
MKTLFVFAAVGLIASNAMAISAYDSKSMTCSDIQQKMKQEGQIVLRYPSSSHSDMMMYNRYVSNSTSCLGQGAMTSANVPTADGQPCKVKTCSFTTGKGPNKNH